MNEDQQNNLESKESLDSSLEGGASQSSPSKPEAVPTSDPVSGRPSPLKILGSTLSKRWSIYLPIFLILLVGIIVVAVVLYKHENNHPTLAEQTLTPTQLNNLANNNEVVGSSNQILTVQSSSIFDGQVLIRGQLQVAGSLKVGNNLSLSGLTVSGSSQIGQLQINKSLDVAGVTTLSGTLTVQNDLSVSGNGTFSGTVTAPQITANILQLNGDLSLSHHIVSNGALPNNTAGAAIGSGGTVSVNGSDTAGTVTINTGGSPTAGCYITVSFAAAFNSTPHVIITPVGQSSAGLSYYVNRSSTNFSVCSASTPNAGQTYAFDYFVIE